MISSRTYTTIQQHNLQLPWYAASKWMQSAERNINKCAVIYIIKNFQERHLVCKMDLLNSSYAVGILL